MPEKTKEELRDEIEKMMLEKIKILAEDPWKFGTEMLANYVETYREFIRAEPTYWQPYPTIYDNTIKYEDGFQK